MRFAVVLPWWGYALAFGVAGLLAWLAYARASVQLTAAQRTGLTLLRAITLFLLIAALLRPVAVVPSDVVATRVVPLLIDVSRSMRLEDDDGTARIEQARALGRQIVELLGPTYRVELLTFGESLARATPDEIAATARRSDLSGALAELAERYRNDRLAGVVVLSDGGDTSSRRLEEGRLAGPGVHRRHRRRRAARRSRNRQPDGGRAAAARGLDRPQRVGGEQRLRHRSGGAARQRQRPPRRGAPGHAGGGRRADPRGVHRVARPRTAHGLHRARFPAAAASRVVENNTPQRAGAAADRQRRQVLIVEGAPGFEHTFLKRALAEDLGLDVDAVVRKGQNDDGRDTFFVQAGASRAAALSSGYPVKREELFAYDAIIFGNIEADFFTRDQLELTARFVAERGGGLLVLGARSFDRQGLAGTPLEEVLPVDLTDRRATMPRRSLRPRAAKPRCRMLPR